MPNADALRRCAVGEPCDACNPAAYDLPIESKTREMCHFQKAFDIWGKN